MSMNRSFVSEIASFAVGLGQLRQTCPPASGHATRSEVQSVLSEINRAKAFIQTRGDQGTLLGLKSCAALKLMRRDSIPLTPQGFMDWLTATEQKLDPEGQQSSPAVPYQPNNTQHPISIPANNNTNTPVSFWDQTFMTIGDTEITTTKALLGGMFIYLLYKEGYLRYYRSES